ncbi:MAG: hypothetical protein ORN51_08365 [Akkermansiaceae bacterium]|nr:hypothetical protein [Akkermansiaceae bacterium]
MRRITILHLIPAFLTAASHAGEVAVELRPFVIEKSFPATALPSGDATVLKLQPKAWTDFKITQVQKHGAKVTKGEVLVRFDPEGIDQKIDDARHSLTTLTLKLAQAESDIKIAEETVKNKLDALRNTATIAKEENAYFTHTRRNANEEAAHQALKHSNQLLENQREELKQLTLMYQADDITENTEEIILTRQKDAVAAAEFAQRMETLEHKRTLEVTLPREAKTLADNERDTAINLKKAETDLPRSIQLSKLELESLQITQSRTKKDLAELEADRSLFEIKAPSEGWFYYGQLENGRWNPNDAMKTLTPNGHPPAQTAYATFVPSTTKLNLIAFLDEATARSLKTDITGSATLAGREDLEIPVKLAKLAGIPNPDGTCRADLTATWPADFIPTAGITPVIHLIAYQKSSAIVVPTKALTFGASGWSVQVKLASGKPEQRSVKCGRVSEEETEILSGLEAGQVVVVP